MTHKIGFRVRDGSLAEAFPPFRHNFQLHIQGDCRGQEKCEWVSVCVCVCVSLSSPTCQNRIWNPPDLLSNTEWKLFSRDHSDLRVKLITNFHINVKVKSLWSYTSTLSMCH
jgi:hypothetical protein